ncbi:MAG: hypothetical protein M1837_003130 [Sclerophora amabilis]|nr:MAG: hypothetical protein M1837_003130 [Sclerophora amabilis]
MESAFRVKAMTLEHPPKLNEKERLGELPNELLDKVYAYLDVLPPSRSNLEQDPSPTRPETAPTLKQLSCTSRLWRSKTLPWLFRYCYVNLHLESPESPQELTEAHWNILPFTRFLITAGLVTCVKSMVLHARQDFSLHEPLWQRPSQKPHARFNLGSTLWPALYRVIAPEELMIVAPPATLGYLTGNTVDLADAWAFDIPFQVLSLSRSIITIPEVNRSDFVNDSPLLAAYPWKGMMLVEGSSIPAYHTYEYFLKTMPSVVPALRDGPQGKSLQGSLTSFRYTAVFPFYNHLDFVLTFVKACDLLYKLRIRITPCKGSEMLECYMDYLDPNDLWMEVDTSYTLILHTVHAMGLKGTLKEFVSDDCVESEDIRHPESMFEHVLSGWRRLTPGSYINDITPSVDE